MNKVKRNDVGQFFSAATDAKADMAYAGAFNFTYTAPDGSTQTFSGTFQDETPFKDPN